MSLRTGFLVAGVLVLMAVIVFRFDYFLLKNSPDGDGARSVTLYDLLLNTNLSSAQNINTTVSRDPSIDGSWMVYESAQDHCAIAYPPRMRP